MRKKARFSRENVTILDSLLAGPSPFCLALTPSTLPLRLPPPQPPRLISSRSGKSEGRGLRSNNLRPAVFVFKLMTKWPCKSNFKREPLLRRLAD